jgi:predicted transcriptional regulator
MTKETNLSIATRIVASTPAKALALSEIMAVLGVTRSNAFVYYTKATKGVAKPAVGAVKAEKVSKPAKESIQGTSSTKKAQKLAEIDAFLASNAASSKGNPFAALGA